MAALLRPPEVLISDGGPEFQEAFARAGEHAGVFHHVCDATSPWQNGKCERHGGLVKEALAKAAREAEPRTARELEHLLHETLAAKNRYFHRGGFSPTGENIAFRARS